MSTDAELERLLRTLRAQLRSGPPGDVALPGQQLRLLLDELGRLQQSADRLRRQNRRLRLRLQRATGEVGEDSDGGDDAAS